MNNQNTNLEKEEKFDPFLVGLGKSFVGESKNFVKGFGDSIYDQLMGKIEEQKSQDVEQEKRNIPKNLNTEKRSGTAFEWLKYNEENNVREQIEELTRQIKDEIDMIKQADASLLAEAEEAQKLALNSPGKKTGIYHVRFLEIVLKMLKNLRAKIGEARTWLSASNGRRKQRGGVFKSKKANDSLEMKMVKTGK